MKVGFKSLLIVLVLLALVALAFFAISSGKISFNNAGKTENTVLQEDEEDEEEDEDSEAFENEISLEITSPKDGAVVKESPVLVTGLTVKAADVFVNDAETKADNGGNFKVSVPLEEGENEIFVVVNDAEGNYAEASVLITLNTE